MKRRSVLKGMGGMGLAAAGAGFLGLPQRASAAAMLAGLPDLAEKTTSAAKR